MHENVPGQCIVIDEPDRILIREPEREIYWFKGCHLYPIAGIGWEHPNHAKPMGLSPHAHDASYEISYFVQGSVEWHVEQSTFNVERGDLFITHPGERHGGLDGVMHSCERFYLEVMLPDKGSLPGLSRSETQNIVQEFEAIQSHCFPGSPGIRDAFDRLFSAHRETSPHAPIAARAAMHDLLLGVLRDYSSSVHTGSHIATKNKYSPPIQAAMDWMDEHLATQFHMETVAGIADMSTSFFYKRFLNEAGCTPNEYRTRRRIQKGRELLGNDRYSITAIAHTLGFSTSQYFATVFKKYVGLSPRMYRDQYVQNSLQGETERK